jgi:hypothetical protein
MLSPAIFRLFVSQAFLCYLFISITPLKSPVKRNTIIIAVGAFLITLINALVIVYYGLTEFYVRYYFLTLILPYFILLSYFAIYKGPKLLFGFLTCEVFGNVAIVNGLFFSHLLYGVDNAFIDGLVRVATFLLLMPLFLNFVKPKFIEMAETLEKGWWILCMVLILSYILTYYIGFVPESLLSRPEYFIHMYIKILLSGFTYLIIFKFFLEIQSKFESERDKQLLSTQVNAIANQSETISVTQEKIRILRHDMRHQLRIAREHINNGNFEEADSFLEVWQNELTKTSTKVFCENIAINATLSYYFEFAERNSIQIESKVDIPKIININNAELAVAYANGLENAINACLNEPESNKRFINLKSRYNKNQIIIDISNSCSTSVKFNKNNIPVTDVKGRGIGIMSILAFAKKYDSIAEFSQIDNVFYFKLLINLE